VPPADSFVFTESDYNDFKNYVIESGFTYETLSEEFLDELKKIATEEKYLSKSKKEFAALEEKLHHNVKTDLMNFENEIKALISEEILKRYYYKSGEVSFKLKNDIVVKKALEIIKDKNHYTEILQAKAK